MERQSRGLLRGLLSSDPLCLKKQPSFQKNPGRPWETLVMSHRQSLRSLCLSPAVRASSSPRRMAAHQMASRASDSRDIKPTSFRVMGSKGMVYFTPKAARFRYDEQRDTWEAVREPAGVFVEFFRRCGNRFERFSSSPFFLGGRDLGSVLAATGDENRSVDFLSRDEKRKFSVGFNSEDAIKPVSLRLELFPGTPDGQTKDTEAAEEATGGKGDRDSPATASDLEVAMRRSELLHLQGFLREILPAVYGWQVLEDPRRVVAFASNPD